MYLIIGGSGFLGRYFIQSILDKTADDIVATCRCPGADLPRLSWRPFEIRDRQGADTLADEFGARDDLKLIVLAAFHHPDKVQEDPTLAWSVNVTALSYLVNRFPRAKAVFYASTDSVYGNSKDRYRFKESDGLNPVNIYGREKAAAEGIIRWLPSGQGRVVRFPFLIAPSLVPGRPHFYDRIVADLQNGKIVEMFEDSYRSSLNFKTAAELTVALAEQPDIAKVPPIVNVCGDKAFSKYDVGLLIADRLGVSRELVKPIRVADHAEIFKTARASSTLMDNTLLKSILKLGEVKFSL